MSGIPHNGPGDAGSEFDLHGLVLSLRRRWRFALGGAVLAGGLAAAWLWNVEPVYRASATLRLEEDASAGGVLGELAALGKAPAAAAEIAVLSSRQLAESTVAPALDGALRDPEQLRLGLTTRVEDPRRRPLRAVAQRLLGRSSSGGRLRAAVTAAEAGAPRSVQLEFGDEPGRVTLSDAEGFGFGAASATVEFRAAEPFEALGLTLVFKPEGELAGRTLLLHRDDPRDAARRLVGGTRVVETQRNSGVLSVTVSDSDPLRAAESANALVANYLARSVESGRRRASQAVDFIKSQLVIQGDALEEAEAAVVELKRAHPETIDPSAAASRLIADLADFELSRLQLQLAAANLGDALAMIEQGNLEGLSRLGPTLVDPLGATLVEQLTQLSLELQLQDRADATISRQRLATRLDELGDLAAALDAQVSELKTLLSDLAAGDRNALAMLGGSGAGVAPDPLTGGYLAQIAELDGRIELLSQGMTTAHPELSAPLAARTATIERLAAHLAGRLDGLRSAAAERRAEVERTAARLDAEPAAERAQITAAMDDLIDRTAAHLTGRAQSLAAEDAELAKLQTALDQRLAALPERELALAAPMRRLETHKELVTYLLTSLQEAEINRAVTVPRAEIVDPAIAPSGRYAPRLSVTLLGSVLAGLCAGLSLGALAERLRNALHDSRELERVTGLPVLASIPDFTQGPARVPGAGAGFVALRDEPHGPVAEAYRSLRANLRFAAGDIDSLKTLAVTSCSPGEGKSTTNVDLAWAFASGGRRVLLVDADLRRPAAHKYLNLQQTPGLAEVLAGEHDWRQCIQHTPNSSLQVLSAGDLVGNASDILDGEPARALLDSLTSNYDLVVFDLPPALVVADVEGFAHRLDGVVLLYRSGGLAAESVRAACLRLRQAGVKLIGAVLNADRGVSRTTGYGSYGGDANNYYLAAGEASERQSA